jgi:large subunit ribosomal protein L17
MRALVSSLVEHERIRTTEAKAKELRPLVERTISWSTRVADLVKKGEHATADEKARVVHAMRMARRVLRDRQTLSKLFHEVGPRFHGRPGGYTRIIKLGFRRGDAAPQSLIELLPAEKPPETKGKKGKPGKAPGAGGEAAAVKAQATEGKSKAKQPRSRQPKQAGSSEEKP